MDPAALLTLGVLLGVRHALDPDHVIAVGTISAPMPSIRRSAGVGAVWGLGHTLTILGVGGSIVLLRAAISSRAELMMELTVAVMLIVLGVMNLAHARHAQPVVPSSFRPFAVGMVHGMAGSAAIALLVLATIPDTLHGIVYLLLFGMGTIVGMIGVTVLMTVPMALITTQAGVSRRWLTAASGLVSVAFGASMIHHLA